MLGCMDDPEKIIAAAIERHARGDLAALARAILNELWRAGYDVTPRHDAAVSRYSEADERQVLQQRVTEKPGELFQPLAEKLRNESMRDRSTRLRGSSM